MTAAAEPTRTNAAPPSTLLAALAEVTRAHPHERKRLIGPDLNFGRELLLALAQRTGGWIGWEAANVREIARELAFVPLAEQGITPARDVEINLLVSRALTRLVERSQVGGQFAELARSLGFRRALRDAVLELRTAGVQPHELRTATSRGTPSHDLAAVLEEYEGLLRAERRADPAGVFHVALEHVDREAPYVLDGVIALVPTVGTRGLAGRLVEKLASRGATILPIDLPADVVPPPHIVGANGEESAPASILAWAGATTIPNIDTGGLSLRPADVDFFSAATPSNEVREVCRRVIAEGLRWDEVEIVATDPDAYGIALDALSQQVGIEATMLSGVPLARTRIGRAIDRWFDWLGDGLPADVLRQALEAGEIGVEESGLPSTSLAREVRALKIGWGRARYEAALERLRSGARLAEVTRYEDESEEDFEERRTSRGKSARGATMLLERLLDAVPEVPERGSERVVRSSCAQLAKATLAFLALVKSHGQSEAQTLVRIRSRLELLAELHDEEATFTSALATLREALADVRAWPLQTNDRKPWSATGGMLHLTDVGHGGTTGRARTFVVGFDAGRTAGAGRQDPLLPDNVRAALGSARLSTAAERRREWGFALGVMLASLRGRVTMSYAVSAALDGREEGPSPLLLQAWRLASGEVKATYEMLRHALYPPASPVPSREGTGVIGKRDVWLRAIADGALLLDASVPVRARHAALAAGLDAHELMMGTIVTEHHGMIAEAGEALDLLRTSARAISPSSLESLAKCPLSWFYTKGLRLRDPSDPEFDPDRWLDEAQRGSLLHEVYESFGREYAPRQEALHDDAARARVLAIVDDRIVAWRKLVPPPGETVFDRECAELRRSAIAFLDLERTRRLEGDRGEWRDFEVEFGGAGREGSFSLSSGASIAIRGKADRIDRLPDGTLRVIDYKTGSVSYYRRDPKRGVFNGGRQLQPALYAAAVAQVTGGVVSAFEYRFPTPRGENQVVTYAAQELEQAKAIVSDLAEGVRHGRFLPTMDVQDCRYCDCKPICRAEQDDYRNVFSPRASWGKAHGGDVEEYEPMRRHRAPSRAAGGAS